MCALELDVPVFCVWLSWDLISVCAPSFFELPRSPTIRDKSSCRLSGDRLKIPPNGTVDISLHFTLITVTFGGFVTGSVRLWLRFVSAETLIVCHSSRCTVDIVQHLSTLSGWRQPRTISKQDLITEDMMIFLLSCSFEVFLYEVKSPTKNF